LFIAAFQVASDAPHHTGRRIPPACTWSV